MESGKLSCEPVCPHCNKILNGFTDVKQQGYEPEIDDITICAYCDHVLVYKQSNLPTQNAFKLDYVSVDEFIELDDFAFTIAEKNGRIIVTGVK